MKTLLVGDVSPTAVTNPLFAAGDVEALFSDVVSLFEGNDVNFVNLECALTDCDKQIEKFGPPLKACANVANVLKEVGVNYCGLSNNHVFDFGIQGARDTLKALDEAGIVYTGFGENYEDSRKNLIITANGEKLAVIAVCEHEYSYALEDRMGSRPYDEYHTMDDIRKAKGTCDRVVVIYHGGKEYCAYPSPRLRRLAQAMARNGADVVLCQHSHCIGCYEQYAGCHILYGQGNFHFVKPSFIGPEIEKIWNSSLAVKHDSATHEIEFIPLVVENDGIAQAKGEEKETLLQEFANRNEELQNGSWKEGWHAFCESVKDNYLGILSKSAAPGATEMENKHFGHYLDCEAHTDVWRELFPTANMTNEREQTPVVTSEVTETSEASQVSRIVDNEVRRLTSTKTYNKGTVRTIEDDRFYKLQLVVDKKTGKFSYYLDGELLEKDVAPFHNSAEETLVNVVTALYRYNEAAEAYSP